MSSDKVSEQDLESVIHKLNSDNLDLLLKVSRMLLKYQKQPAKPAGKSAPRGKRATDCMSSGGREP